MTATGVPATTTTPGSCQQVTGQCGFATNHTFVPYNYQCGSEAGCPSCPTGQMCSDHICVTLGLNCPSTSTVGATVTCQLTENNQSCSNCNASITAPDGSQTNVTSDSKGNVQITTNNAGNYVVSNGQSHAYIATIAPPTPAQPVSTPVATTTPFNWWIWLLLLLIIAIILYYYQRRRRQKKTTK